MDPLVTKVFGETLHTTGSTKSIKSVPIMYIKIEFEDANNRKISEKLPFILDTGAELSIISSYLSTLSNVKLNPTGTVLKGFAGKKIKPMGELLLLLKFEPNVDIEHKFLLAETPHNIIGIDFLRKYKIFGESTTGIVDGKKFNINIESTDPCLKILNTVDIGPGEIKMVEVIMDPMTDEWSKNVLITTGSIECCVEIAHEPFYIPVANSSIHARRFEPGYSIGDVRLVKLLKNEDLCGVHGNNGRFKWR